MRLLTNNEIAITPWLSLGYWQPTHADATSCKANETETHRDGLKTLVIWRNCKVVDNNQLCMFFDKMDFRTRDTEFDVIYVNGDNTLPNLRRDEDHWKVVLIEEEFQKRMFEE